MTFFFKKKLTYDFKSWYYRFELFQSPSINKKKKKTWGKEEILSCLFSAREKLDLGNRQIFVSTSIRFINDHQCNIAKFGRLKSHSKFVERKLLILMSNKVHATCIQVDIVRFQLCRILKQWIRIIPCGREIL